MAARIHDGYATYKEKNIGRNAVLHSDGWNIKIQTMTTLTVTARGQVTFRKDVLQHIGIRPEKEPNWTNYRMGECRSRRCGLPER